MTILKDQKSTMTSIHYETKRIPDIVLHVRGKRKVGYIWLINSKNSHFKLKIFVFFLIFLQIWKNLTSWAYFYSLVITWQNQRGV